MRGWRGRSWLLVPNISSKQTSILKTCPPLPMGSQREGNKRKGG